MKQECGNCAKFTPDSINPAGGLGECPELVERNNLDGQYVEILKYPGQRGCEFHVEPDKVV